jgi:hypothetical protein
VTYQDATSKNAQQSAATVAGLVAALLAAQMAEGEFHALMVATVLQANARAVTLADAALSATMTLGRRVAVPHLGLSLPPTEPDRLSKAVQTTLTGESGDFAVRFTRLARAEPLTTGRRAFQEGMAEHGVEGWTRKASLTACALCRGLADGSVIPINRQMIDHPGCTCVAVPVVKTERTEPARSFITGHGIDRREHRQYVPGLRFTQSRPPKGLVK